MTVIEVKAEHKRRSDELTRKQNENALLQRQIDENEKRMLECAEKLGVVKDSILFLEELANSRRGAMKGKIEDVVSEALRLIYGTDYRVELSYAVKNNRSALTIEMVRKTPQGDVRREIGGFGGGVADTISVPLRLMVLLGSKQAARICVLDECYKHVDAERIELVAEFLQTLSNKLHMQILMCTHHDIIRDRADRTFMVTEQGGKSKVTAN
jgi:DNA repair exonuclease SbcCD ATPase subunit